jgi:hypothetical protein
MQVFTKRNVALIVVAAIAIEVLGYVMDLVPSSAGAWVLLVLGGPLVTGLVFGYLRKPWLLAAATWALAGILSLLTDWIFLNEDKVFHLALTIVMVVLVAIGTAAGRGIRRLLRGDANVRRPVH